ncbi:MAG TPA: DUF2157 domain-containing protein [Actinomycetes bacterium]|nr:DUF2157 domain-containing protein [Actinomycetes bacterium]
MEELGRRVARWVEAGVIGAEQGEAILALEGLEGDGGGPAGGRRAVVVEVLGYLGGVLALVAGLVLGAESWDRLGHWGRVGVLGLVTGVLLAAGWRLRGGGSRVLPRLASVLWLGAVAGFAGLLAVLLDGDSSDALGDPSLWVAAGALLLAGGLYLLERRVLQQVALFAAVVATMVAGGQRLGWSWETVEGYGLLVLGAGWLELGRRGLVAPRRTSEALGSLALLSGPEVLDAAGSGPGDWGLWLGLGLAVALVVAGSALRRNVPLGIGAAGMVVFLGQVAGEHWRDLGAPLAILLVGLGLVAAAVVLARLRPVVRGGPQPPGVGDG